MEIESVLMEETHHSLIAPKGPGGERCLFYKSEVCCPSKRQFKMCARCHRCHVIAPDNMLPKVFDKIVGIAGLMMGTLGMGIGSSSGGGGSVGSGGTGGGGGGGGGK